MGISSRQFADRLTQSGLVSAEEVRLLATGSDESSIDEARKLARWLLETDRLTEYQFKAICSDEYRHLALGPYVTLGPIGTGGMGVVYKGRHRVMKRNVAIKVLNNELVSSPKSRARFLEEVETSARLLHPNIVITHDAAIEDDIAYLVMEFLDGHDLDYVVRKQGPLSWPRAVVCILQAAIGLDYAHNNGVVHRDIKPANLMMTDGGVIKILDLGLARLRMPDGSGGGVSVTSMNRAMGTVDYISPEQAQDAHSVDQRSDIYSLGCALFFLLRGRPLFADENMVGKLLAHRDQPPPQLAEDDPTIPAALEAVYQRMVCKHPKDRQQTTEELIHELDEVLRATSALDGEQIAEMQSSIRRFDVPEGADTPGEDVVCHDGETRTHFE